MEKRRRAILVAIRDVRVCVSLPCYSVGRIELGTRESPMSFTRFESHCSSIPTWQILSHNFHASPLSSFRSFLFFCRAYLICFGFLGDRVAWDWE